jgi:stalled ribosome rescue protein Dom34
VSHYHAVVWLDHGEAHVLHFTPEEVENTEIKSKDPHRKVHGKHTLHEKRHPDAGFLGEVADALRGAKEVLVCGPGSAKLELIRHLHKHAHDVESAVVGIETVDHPSDGQLLAYARKYFRAADRMR